MSDTKLDPATLTAEERAIWDRIADKVYFEIEEEDTPDWCECYEIAREEAVERILARRALFGTATEKAVCPNCGDGYFWDHSRCPPAQPEPAAPVHRVTEQGRVEVNKAALFASPAVQEVYEIAGRIVDHGKPDPAAVRSAAKRLRRLAVAYRESLDEHEHRNMLDKKADDAEGKR